MSDEVPIEVETDSFAREIPFGQRRASTHELRVLAAPEAALFSAPPRARRGRRGLWLFGAVALLAGAAAAAVYLKPDLLRPSTAAAPERAAAPAPSQSAAEPLWSPCLSAPLVASAGPREVPCGAGKLAIQREGEAASFALSGLPSASVAAELPKHVGAALPNLGQPAQSLASACDGPEPGKPSAPPASLEERLAAFHATMAALASCRSAGGRRMARWKLPPEREFEARTSYGSGASQVVLSLGPAAPPPGPSGSAWQPVPWQPGPFLQQAAPDALEAALEAAGYFPGDAAALRAAAKQSGFADSAETLDALVAVIRFVQGSSGWMLHGRTRAYATCVGPALQRLGDAQAEMRFRVLAGVTPEAAKLLAEPAARNANAEVLAQRFDAAFGSALHFRCVLDLGCMLVRGKVLELAQLTAGLDRDRAAIAPMLLCDARFAERALTELGASRLKLVAE